MLDPVLLRNQLEGCFEEDFEILADCGAIACSCAQEGEFIKALTDSSIYKEM